jgi:membrane fusion protein, multidrug efflux system
MKKNLLIGLAVVLLSLCFKVASPAEPVTALVQTQTLRPHTLTDQLTCYGTVILDPDKVININFPRAGQITHVLVTQGERVKKGMPLLEFETSPQDSAGYVQARSAVELARNELARQQSLATQQLATQSQVAQAQKALIDAEAALAAQKQLGTDRKSEVIVAPFDGLVSVSKAIQRERVQAGTTALQLAQQDGWRVVLGVEPENLHKIKPGTPVQVASVFEETLRGSGLVQKVQGMVNPQTRLVDLTVVFKDQRTIPLMPGMPVRGEILLQKYHGLAVPRQALLQDKQGSYVFVVRGGLAHRLNVRTGIKSQGLVGISGPFRPADLVVVSGNYELKEGMSVRGVK